MVAEIRGANPVLNAIEFNCFFSRSEIPNAAYIGEGIILFNMGLFNKIVNESQAAFVLCHEISHFYLHHKENRILKYLNLINSDEVQNELHKIKNSEYKKGQELDKLLKGMTFNSRRHSRDHESQADSMALELMRHTRFDITESLSLLTLLDSIDVDFFETDKYLGKLFDAKEYPFQNKWIKKEEGLLGGHAVLEINKLLVDSLKTLPDCMQRVKHLNLL